MGELDAKTPIVLKPSLNSLFLTTKPSSWIELARMGWKDAFVSMVRDAPVWLAPCWNMLWSCWAGTSKLQDHNYNVKVKVSVLPLNLSISIVRNGDGEFMSITGLVDLLE